MEEEKTEISLEEVRLQKYHDSLNDLIDFCKVIDHQENSKILPSNQTSNEMDELNDYKKIINHQSVEASRHVKFVKEFYYQNKQEIFSLYQCFITGSLKNTDIQTLSYDSDNKQDKRDNITLYSKANPDYIRSIFIKKYLWYTIFDLRNYIRLLYFLVKTLYYSIELTETYLGNFLNMLEKKLGMPLTTVSAEKKNIISSKMGELISALGFVDADNVELKEDMTTICNGLTDISDFDNISNIINDDENDINPMDIIQKLGLDKILKKHDNTGTLSSILENDALKNTLNGLRKGMKKDNPE